MPQRDESSRGSGRIASENREGAKENRDSSVSGLVIDRTLVISFRFHGFARMIEVRRKEERLVL